MVYNVQLGNFLLHGWEVHSLIKYNQSAYTALPKLCPKNVWLLDHAPTTCPISTTAQGGSWGRIEAIHDLFLTTVGGYSNSDGKLHTCITRDKKWVERFPPIGCMYVEAFAASTRERVIVVGKRVHRGNTRMGLLYPPRGRDSQDQAI